MRTVNIQNWLAWAQKRVIWKVQDWARLLWSASRIKRFGSKKWHIVRRRDDEAYHSYCIRPLLQFGGGKLIIWECFSSNGKGPLVRFYIPTGLQVYINTTCKACNDAPNLWDLWTEQWSQTLCNFGVQLFEWCKISFYVYVLPASTTRYELNWDLWFYIDSNVKSRLHRPPNLDDFSK